MKSTIAHSQEDEDLLLVTMTFFFDGIKGPELRKRLEILGFKLYPLDNVRLKLSPVVFLAGQANTSIRNEFTILRHYEISEDFNAQAAMAKEHAGRYYQRVQDQLKDIGEIMTQSWT